MEIYNFFQFIKSDDFLSEFISKHYVGKPNSMFRTVKEAETRYLDGGSATPCLRKEEEIDRYNRFLEGDFGPESTLMDVFDVIYFDYPILCSDIKNACNVKMKKVNDDDKHEPPIFSNKFMPAGTSLIDILRLCLDDKLLDLIARSVYNQKYSAFIKNKPEQCASKSSKSRDGAGDEDVEESNKEENR